MLFGPSDLIRYTSYSPIPSSTSVDPNGTCKIHYGSPDPPPLPNFMSHFNIYGGESTDIHTVEFHYHIQPTDFNNRFEFLSIPSTSRFKTSCPIWHFVDKENKGPKPKCNIFVTYHGEGELPHDYDTMLNSLLCLMEALTLSGFEDVAVKIVPGRRVDDGVCPVPSEMAIKLLRYCFEHFLGGAEMRLKGDECWMRFRPRSLAETWSKQPRGGEATRARSRAVLLRHQRRAKRGLRNLLKV